MQALQTAHIPYFHSKTMSYFQPLITSAFASYSISRNAYTDRASGVTQGDTDNSAQNAIGVQPNERIGSTSGTEKTQETGKTVEKSVDRDAGKPQSASGDVLDLSQKAQDKVDELNKQADAQVDEYRASRKQDSAEAEESKIEVDEDVRDLAAAQAGSGAAMESSSELTPEEEQQVEELKARDAEVRTHEQQHVAVGGPYVTGGPTYTYQTGPDGRQYAIGGEVSIDTGEVSGDPEATIQKMQTVAAAAMAPAEPSGQDHKVAAAARQAEAKARAELSKQQTTEMSGEGEEDGTQAAMSTDDAMASESSNEDAEQSSNVSSAAPSESGKSDASSNISVAPAKNNASSAASSAYQAASSMTSGQSGGSLFSAFA